MICGHGHEQKFKYPNPRDSKIIQMPYPRAKAIDQNPARSVLEMFYTTRAKQEISTFPLSGVEIAAC